MTTPFQQSPYLREQRDFPPDDVKALAVQSDRAYIDVAQAVNSRTIGLFALNRQIVTGNQFYFSGPTSKQQSIRLIFQVSDSNLTINHGIQFNSVFSPFNIFGSFIDGSGTWQTLPYVDVTAAINQISVKVTSTQLVVTKGAGAPSIVSGVVVVEWISQF